MFTDKAIVKLGDTTVVVTRLTLKEIRAERLAFRAGEVNLDESYDKIIKEHVKTEDGKAIDPETLSFRQMQTLVKELVGIPEGSGISDFIGLLC